MSRSDNIDTSIINTPAKVLIALAGILAGFLLSRIFIVPVTVHDTAMEPSLKKGSHVIVLKHITPMTGDVILAESPGEKGRYFLKRVIALEGNTVEIRQKIIYVDNKKTVFPWKTISRDARIFPMNFTSRDNMVAVKLKRGEYFLLNDNLDIPSDSRELGLFTGDAISGKVVFSY